MSLTKAMIDALLANGGTVEQLAAIVKADMDEQEARREAKRAGNAERQQRFRDNRRNGKARNTRNALRDVTPIERDIHTLREDISSDEESLSDCERVVSAWNGMAKPIGLAACNALIGKRRTACRVRLRDYGLPSVLKAIEHVPRSAFLRGETGKWSGANIDFLLKPDTINKILEGQYDDRTTAQNGRGASIIEIGRGLAERLELADRGGP